MMTQRDLDETELDAVFAAVREQQPAPDAAFLARVAEDAASMAAEGCVTSGAVSDGSLRSALRARFGLRRFRGVAAVWLPGSAMAAGLVGLWIGFTAPGGLPDPSLLVPFGDTKRAALVDGDWFGIAMDDAGVWDDG